MPESQARPQTTAAVSGLVTASLAIALVAAMFVAQLAYKDFYTCTNDALTNEAKQSCNQLLPKDLRGSPGHQQLTRLTGGAGQFATGGSGSSAWPEGSAWPEDSV